LSPLWGIEHIEQGDHDQRNGGPKYQVLQKVIQKKSSVVWNMCPLDRSKIKHACDIDKQETGPIFWLTSQRFAQDTPVHKIFALPNIFLASGTDIC
jgi:hypothetical protein